MKKLIATILSIFYLSTSFGATLHFHYCMDKLVSWGFESKEKDQCSKCGMEKEESANGCCKDDKTQVKGEDDQKAAGASLNPDLSSFASLVRFFEYKLTSAVNKTGLVHFTPSPPGKPGIAVYLRNCVFLI